MAQGGVSQAIMRWYKYKLLPLKRGSCARVVRCCIPGTISPFHGNPCLTVPPTNRYLGRLLRPVLNTVGSGDFPKVSSHVHHCIHSPNNPISYPIVPKYTWRKILHEKWREGEREKERLGGGEGMHSYRNNLERIISSRRKSWTTERASYIETKIKTHHYTSSALHDLQGQTR